jgi:hypothetical protein
VKLQGCTGVLSSMHEQKYEMWCVCGAVLSDPVKRYEYDMQGNYALQDYSIAVSISSFLGWLVNFVHSKLYMFYL